MDMNLQTRLLRVLEDGIVKRIGATKEVVVDVRVVSASHRDLQAMVDEGKFRRDLYFRLSTIPIFVPPLRDRPQDIPALATHFVLTCFLENHLRRKTLEPETLSALQRQAWPGNIRELKNLCERMAIMGVDPIGPTQLPDTVHNEQDDESSLFDLDLTLREFKRRSERRYIDKVLTACNNNYSLAAEKLGIQRTYLYQKTRQLEDKE